ncbi:MAG: tRNA 2-thiouridine(34) synthase MnmA [Oscillospiraceae bacterium]
MSKKVVLGLSGGVDSAVSARLLSDLGFEVFGLFLDIGGEAARSDALSVADFLKIPLKILDIREALEANVCAPFAAAYLRGETPNPCILCNPSVKFKALLEYADSIDAEYISTGHYAQTKDGKLFKGHPENDQSYMLCRLTSEQVRRLILPLGGMAKQEIRALAEGMNLPVANKPDSMEICFIPDGDYAEFIERRGEGFPPPGNFVDPLGNILGRHKGIHHYTIGQRRGLGIAVGKRIFVSEIRPATNEVVLRDGDILYTSEISVRSINWLVPQSDTFSADVRVRHSRVQTAAVVTPTESGAMVRFNTPVRAPTAGQSAVFYIGDMVVGGGFIEAR